MIDASFFPRDHRFLSPATFAHAIRNGEIDFLDALALAPEVLAAMESKQGWTARNQQEYQKAQRGMRRQKEKALSQ